MNPAFTVWMQLILLLAAEVTLVVCAAALLQRAVKSASWRRTIWQICILAALMLAVSEISGVGRSLFDWFASNSAPAAATKGTVSNDSVTPQLTTEFRQKVAERIAVSQQTTSVNAQPISRPVPPQTTSVRPNTASHHFYGNDSVPDSLRVLWLGLIWLIGSASALARAGLARLLLAALRWSWRAVTDESLQALVHGLRERLGIRQRVRLVESPSLAGPIAFGVFCPAIGLPLAFSQKFAPPQREAMLAHELAHLAARDPLWYLLADLAAAILWWHPLVWWARRQLHAASETAADEASLLVADGPSLLAECLVELGGRLARPRSLSPLGVAGFRSGLGRRVERLLRLRGHSWTPQNRLFGAMAKSLGPAALAVTTILCTAWVTPKALTKGETMKTMKETWKRSLAAFALLTSLNANDQRALAESRTTDSALSSGGRSATDKRESSNIALEMAAEVHSLAERGKRLFEQGKLDEARTNFLEVLKRMPDSKLASHYLALTEQASAAVKQSQAGETKERTEKPAEEERDTSALYYNRLMMERYGLIPKDSTQAANSQSTGSASELMRRRYGLPAAKKDRSHVESKLEEILLEEVTFDGLPLPQVLQFLNEESRKRDPERRGINFLINPNVQPVSQASLIDPTTGQSIPAPAPEPMDMNNVIVKFNLPLREVRLKDVLDAVVKVADSPLEYSVEEYGVVFSARPENYAGSAPLQPQYAGNMPLEVRTFRVDTNTFLAGLESAFGITPDAGSTADNLDAEKVRIKLRQAEKDVERTARNVELGLVSTDELEKAKLSRDLLVVELKQVESGRGKAGADRRTGQTREIQNALRRLLVQLGINMETPGKSVFYNELTGIVMVRATADDLNLVQAAIETLGGSAGGKTSNAREGSAESGVGSGISVIGQVQRPGRYALPSDQQWTLLDAIAAAGDFTKTANRSRIELKRGSQLTKYRFDSLRTATDPTQNPPVRDGDVVFVHEALF